MGSGSMRGKIGAASADSHSSIFGRACSSGASVSDCIRGAGAGVLVERVFDWRLVCCTVGAGRSKGSAARGANASASVNAVWFCERAMETPFSVPAVLYCESTLRGRAAICGFGGSLSASGVCRLWRGIAGSFTRGRRGVSSTAAVTSTTSLLWIPKKPPCRYCFV